MFSSFKHLLTKGMTLTRESRKNLLVLSLAVGVMAFIFNSFGGLLIRGKQTTIVTAASDLSAGTVLQTSDLKDITINGTAPPGIVTTDDEAKGLALALPVKTGTPLVKSIVTKEPLRNGLYPGEVGIWIGVSLVSAGLVNPGDIVDVIPQYDSNHPMPILSSSAIKGLRVVNVVNGSAQSTKGETGGNAVPAAVELAVPDGMKQILAQASLGKIMLAQDPYAPPLLTSNTINQTQAGVPGTVTMPSTNNIGGAGAAVTPANTGSADVLSNKSGSTVPSSSQTVQTVSPQTQANTDNSYVPPAFNPNTSSSQ